MSERTARRAGVFGMIASGALLSGCMSSPTYGTDKTATEQLVGDVSGLISIAPKNKPAIEYKPRPELVKPAKGEVAALPAPQDSILASDSSAWPESPEQRRTRLRADATENRDKPGFRPQIEGDVTVATVSTDDSRIPERAKESGVASAMSPNSSRKQRADVEKRLAEQRQGSSTSRKYLSEPPLAYREPAASAPVDELGEDELKKERRRKAEARKAGSGSRWGDLWPF